MDFQNRSPSKTRERLLLAGRMVLALIFLAAGGAKLAGMPEIVDLFAQIGFGQWFRYLTAALEIAGAGLLLVRATAMFGGALLAMVMVGAVITNVVLGHNAAGAIILLLASASIGLTLRRL